VPPIEVTLRDGTGRAIDHWIFSAGFNQLAAGETAAFATRRIDPPASARHFQIALARSRGGEKVK
jgi:hypothetical protein